MNQQIEKNLTLLIVTDLHASRQALNGIDDLLHEKEYDAILMLGDLINPTPVELPYVSKFIDLIKSKHKLPLFGLHGNNEPKEAYKIYRDAKINVHLETRQLGEYNICGIGGWGYLDEEGFENLSINNLILNEKTIFLTHLPPSKSTPPDKGPLVHLFGHKHVLAYCKQLGPTLLVQCPAGNLGRVTELELPAKKVRFLELKKARLL